MPNAEKKPAARSPRCHVMRRDASGRTECYHPHPMPFHLAKRIVREINATRAWDERFYLRTIDA